MLLQCSINTPSFVHDKSSSTSQLIKGKSRDFQKLLKYLSETWNSMFKDGIGGCAGGSTSPGFPGCGSHAGVFPIIFVLHLIDLPCESLSSTPSIASP